MITPVLLLSIFIITDLSIMTKVFYPPLKILTLIITIAEFSIMETKAPPVL